MPPAGDDDDDDDATRAASAVSFDADLRDMTQRACRCEPATTSLSPRVLHVSAAAYFGATPHTRRRAAIAVHLGPPVTQ